MGHINMVAAFDKNQNPTEPINYYVSHDKKCAEKHGFNPDEPAIALFIHA